MERRDFLKLSALGVAGTMVPANIMSAANKADAPVKYVGKATNNAKVTLGFIGLGRQAMYLLGSFLSMDDVRVVAGCDVYDIKRDRFVKRVTDYYVNKKGENPKKLKLDVYEDYQEVLSRKDIDAVVIAVPDHQHAIIAVAACKAGKDVYLEKPLTLTIAEGKLVCQAVRKYNRILQVGSQQRSSEEFIHAATLAREGALGKISRVKVFAGRNAANPVSAAPVPNTLPVVPVPAGLNWDKWLGPMTDTVKYHPDLDPLLDGEGKESLWGAWRWYKPTGGGLMTDWGAHMFDIAQWAIGKDNSGPVEIIPGGYSYYEHLTFLYDNGIVMTEEPCLSNNDQGVKIYGENGWIEVSRGHFMASNPEWDFKKNDGSDVPFESKAPHHRHFIDSVISRNDPNVPVETGHSSCTVCNLANIALELNRPIKWNPIVQKFVNDPEATKLLEYAYRPGYKIEL